MAAKRFGDEARRQVDDEFLASVAQFTSGDGYAVPGEFVVAGGVKPEAS
jgi:hypothetical protein